MDTLFECMDPKNENILLIKNEYGRERVGSRLTEIRSL